MFIRSEVAGGHPAAHSFDTDDIILYTNHGNNCATVYFRVAGLSMNVQGAEVIAAIESAIARSLAPTVPKEE